MKAYNKTEIELTEKDLQKAVESYCKAQFRDYDIGGFFSGNLQTSARVVFKKNGVRD